MLARRVLLVDDHPVFRTGLRRVLEATGRYEIVAEAGNAHEAIRAAEETRPGLILLDVPLPGGKPTAIVEAHPRAAAGHHRAAHHPHPAPQADPCPHRGPFGTRG